MPILNVTCGFANGTTSMAGGACCSWTVPALPGGTTANVTFELWGGGGGGGSMGCTTDCCSMASPGQGGGYAKYQLTVNVGDVYLICAGGAGQTTTADQNGFYGGGYPGGCCCGCTGGISYVTGPAFTTKGVTLCATGGTGGCASQSWNCYSHCGCSINIGTLPAGVGCNGQINASPGPGIFQQPHWAGSVYNLQFAPSGAGPQGGMGGIVVGGGAASWGGTAYWYCTPGITGTYVQVAGPSSGPGHFPGGGGIGGGYYSWCGCSYQVGAPGSPGLVRVTY